MRTRAIAALGVVLAGGAAILFTRPGGDTEPEPEPEPDPDPSPDVQEFRELVARAETAAEEIGRANELAGEIREARREFQEDSSAAVSRIEALLDELPGEPDTEPDDDAGD